MRRILSSCSASFSRIRTERAAVKHLILKMSPQFSLLSLVFLLLSCVPTVHSNDTPELSSRHMALEGRGLEERSLVESDVRFVRRGNAASQLKKPTTSPAETMRMNEEHVKEVERGIARLQRTENTFMHKIREHDAGRLPASSNFNRAGAEVFLDRVRFMIDSKQKDVQRKRLQMGLENWPSRQTDPRRTQSAPPLRRRALPFPPVPDLLEMNPIQRKSQHNEPSRLERNQPQIQRLNGKFRQATHGYRREDRNARHLERLVKDDSPARPPHDRVNYHLQRYRQQREVSRQQMGEVVGKMNQLGPTLLKDQKHLRFTTSKMGPTRGKYRPQDLKFDLKTPEANPPRGGGKEAVHEPATLG